MAIDQKAIFKAIRDQWVNNAPLVAVVSDVHWEIADKSVDYPLATLFELATVPDYTLAVTPVELERVSWSFALYDDGKALATLLGLPALVSAAFDNATLTFGGTPEYSTIIVGRGETTGPNEVPEDGTNRIVMAYDAVFQRL